MATTLPRPGVEVIQQLRTVSPTIVAPTLVPCIVGVCKQIIEVLDDDNTINTDAAVSAPAVATASNSETYNVDALTLVVAVDGGADQTFTLSGATATATVVATTINGASPAPVGFSAYVYNDGTDNYLQLRTTSSGSNRSIQVKDGTANTALGYTENWTYYGVGNYIQDAIYLPQTSFPDPRSNIDELNIDETTIRCFVNLGTSVRELLDSETFLRKGTTGTVTDDGDADATTPLVNLNSVNLLAAATAAQMDGEVDLSTPTNIHNETLALQVDGGGIQRVVFYGQPIVSTIASGWTWTAIQNATLNLLVNGVTHVVTFSGSVSTLSALITEINTSVSAVFGEDIAYEGGSAGENDGSGYLGLFFGAAPGPTSPNIIRNTEVQVVANASTAQGQIYGDQLAHYQMLVGDNPGSEPISDIEAQIDALMGSGFASIESSPAPSNHLRLTNSTAGTESKIEVNLQETTANIKTALFNFGTDAEYTVTGGSFPAKAGDSVYGDGAFLGNIVEVHPGAIQGRVRLDAEVSNAATYATWYIISKNLDAYDPSDWGSTVPTPDFYVDTLGDANIKHDFLRDTTGSPIVTTAVGLYLAYEAVRLDVTPDAATAELLSFDDLDELEDAIGPVTPDNPLAFGMFCAMQNAGDTTISGIGVPSTSAGQPDGTTAGYQKCWDFLESKEVYGVAPMTHDSDIISAGQTHIDTMSASTMKGERILIFHQGLPTREEDDIASSGTDGDKITDTTFDTKDATLSQSLLALGLDPTNLAVADGVFLNIATNTYNYNITGSITDGTIVTVNTSFGAGENDDAFYSTSDLTGLTLISETYSVKVRGATISDSKDTEIDTVVARGESWADRRMWMLQFDQVGATVDGVDQLVDGYYVAAAKAGMVAGYVPSTPFTNLSIAGFTRVTGSNDRYSTTQLDEGAAGGADWIIQEGSGAALTSRHQLTTDLTSVETREQSIVKAIDYCAKFIRGGLRQYIGKFNITQAFIDTLSAVVQGQLRWLIENGVIAGADLNNILQDEDNPDTVLVDITVEALYPCNYIRVTLVV